MDLHKFSISQLLDGLKNKQFSSTELTKHYLKRISKHDDDLNSYISVTEDLALKQADAADKRYHDDKALPLDGICLLYTSPSPRD